MAVYLSDRLIARKGVSPGCLLVTAFCVSLRNERRTYSNSEDVGEATGYRFASVLSKE